MLTKVGDVGSTRELFEGAWMAIISGYAILIKKKDINIHIKCINSYKKCINSHSMCINSYEKCIDIELGLHD